MVEPTGGFQTISGENVLVTPSGTIVGSAALPRRRRRSRGGVTRRISPTPTEEALKMSLPAELREKPVAEVRQRLSVARQLASQKPQALVEAPPEPTKAQEIISKFAKVSAEAGTPSIVGVGAFGFRPRFLVDVSAGVTEAIIPKTKEELIVTGVSLGTGAAVGAGIKGTGFILTKFAPKAVPIVEKGISVAGLGLGGAFIFGKGTQFVLEPTAGGRGKILGETVRELAAFGFGVKVGGKGFTGLQDIIRTRGLKEIPAEAVIDPKFFTGETFPQIKKGQRAGELKSEFFQPVKELGEVGKAPRGFTALPVEPVKEIPKGESFVFGGFSAPRVSPRFLRTGGEERFKLLSFKDFLTGGKPTIVRTEFVDIGFAPGVSAKTPRPSGRVTKEQLEFFGGGFTERTGKLLVEFPEPKAPKGSAFIPFVKAEKEAVTPFGTPIEEIGRGFFIKFGGRRIPIAEVKALGEIKIPEIKPTAGKQTLGEFLGESSRIPESSLVTPELGGIGFVSRGRRGIPDLMTSFIPPSSKRPFGDISRPTPPGRRRVTPRRPTDSFFDIPSSISRQPRRPTPTILFTSFDILSRPRREEQKERVRRRKGTAERKRKVKVVSKRKKRITPIRASFTGIVLGIEEAAKTEKFSGVDIGILPTSIRGLKTKI